MVRTAQVEELEWVQRAELFKPIPRSDATSEPITLKSVDTNRGDDMMPNYRRRLVLRDIKARMSAEQQMEANEHATSLEAFWTDMSLMMSRQKSNKDNSLKFASRSTTFRGCLSTGS